MTFMPARRTLLHHEKHDRSFNGRRTATATERAERHLLFALPGSAAFDGLDRPWWQLAGAAAATLLQTWAARQRRRRDLAQIDRQTLRDAGIDPGIAAFEAAQPFWRPSLPLRDIGR